jgi:RimJ/RimL family protein N-acetyltransferase
VGPTREGPSVRLRRGLPSEYDLLFSWYNDAERVAPFDRFSVDSFDSFVAAMAAAPEDPTSLAPKFIVEEKATGKPIGFIGWYQAHPVLEYLDVWYVLGDTAARGKGYGSEAVGLLVDHLFETSSIERIGATVDVENVPSYRLLERLGFRREGTLRWSLFHHGRWHDVFVYGVTRAEWAAKRPA